MEHMSGDRVASPRLDHELSPQPSESTMSKSPPFNQTPSQSTIGFLDLPPEIRNRIYSLLLTIDEGLYINRICNGAKAPFNFIRDPLDDQPLQPNILSTCSTVSEEASPILYGANSFCFASADLAADFCDRVGYLSNELRRITIENVESREDFQRAITKLSYDNGVLERLELDIFAIQRFTAKQMAEDLADLAWNLYVEGSEELTMESVVDVFCFANFGNAAEYGEYGWETVWGNLEDLHHEESRVTHWDEDEAQEETNWSALRHPWNVQVRRRLLEGMQARELREGY